MEPEAGAAETSRETVPEAGREPGASEIEEVELYQLFMEQSQRAARGLGDPPSLELQLLLLEALQRDQELGERLGERVLRAHTDWRPFGRPRPHLRTFLRNQIVLDHILIALLFPFSLFNILRALFSEFTFSEYDFYIDILQYLRRISVVDHSGRSLLLYTDSLGLLVKFHNVVVFYTRNVYYVLNAALGNLRITAHVYALFVRVNAISLYLAYGLIASSYLCLAAFFFTLCFGMTVIKRYKGVEMILNEMYQNTECLL
ncbi:AFR047Wp [Eremothecium gossypii ATCC 10895]|uniref:AFR047Wp n=1 Tax=Eremothecium gossypii (strain ATCC 10895 / CBS 109.51 / FGSC 9923 / NRRL Y-1056) TaxID=284811 RepID=Q754M5_EREGS|nr:AFR047Wp [Eremothecium gossypii ATCC 10895]AAS53418.1 AFR047Wp [Eremothecium gossypii ATCC 10895]AEY97730.1 FAFR047Wp [Eremothecium gossypii FDAG1]